MAEALEELRVAYPVFRQLPDALRSGLARDLRAFHAAHGHVLAVFDGGPRVPFVFDGKVQVAVLVPSGRHVPLYALGRGDWCPMALGCAFSRSHHPLQAAAATDARGLTLGADVVHACLAAHPDLWAAALEAATTRLLDLTEVVVTLAASTVDQRLAALLLERGPQVEATHQGLADELGTAREVVSRALEHFAAQGLVRLGRARIEVADPRGLAGRQLQPTE